MPHAIMAILIAPMGVIQGIYAKYYGLSLTSLAAVIFFARLFDTVTDPLVGSFSDSYYSLNGTRKPYMIIGGGLIIVSSYFLYVPPVQPSITYFSCWFFLFYLSWTLFEVPHIAWAAELSTTSHEKTRIYSIRVMASQLGLLLFYAAPLLPGFTSHEITPATLKVSVIVSGMIMLPVLYICMKKTPDRLTKLVDGQTRCSRSLKKNNSYEYLFWRSILSNKPLLIFLGAFILTSIGQGMWYGLIFIYVDSYLGSGNEFSKIFLISFTVGFITIQGWSRLAVRLGKKVVWLIATSVIIYSFFSTGILTSQVPSYSYLLILMVLQTIGFSGVSVMTPAILSEIVDYSTWKFRLEKTASFFSLYTFVSKASQGVGAAAGLAIAGWCGFDITATVHSEKSINGIKLAISWLPSLFMALSLIFILMMPINEHRYKIIRRYLDSQKIK